MILSVRSSARYALGLAAALLLLTARGDTAPPTVNPGVGIRENTPAVHALTNARLQISPTMAIERGTVVIRDGLIVAVGREVEIPRDAKVWNLDGKMIYPGFIDAYSDLSIGTQTKLGGAPYWNDRVRPQLDVARSLTLDAKKTAALRSQGITAQLVAPQGAVIDGACALISTADESPHQTLLVENPPLKFRLTVARGPERDEYPNSPMGAVALARQAMLDADWYARAWEAHNSGQALAQPARNDALAALLPVRAGQRLVLFDAPNEWFHLRADRFAKEFKIKAAMVGSGREYRRLDDIAATGRTVIVPLNFTPAPYVASAEAALQAPLASLLHWDIAPENPARLAKAGVPIAFTTRGLKDTKEFLSRLRQAVERGLSREQALTALTTTPAALYGCDKRVGTLEAGKLAHLIVTNGDLFEKKTRIEHTWVEGRPYEVKPPPETDLRGTWSLTIERGKDQPAIGRHLRVTGEDKLSATIAEKPTGGEAKPVTHFGQRGARFSAALPAGTLGVDGITRLSATLDAEKNFASFTGEAMLASGERLVARGERVLAASETTSPDTKEPPPKVDRAASYAVNYPLGAMGVAKPPEQPAAILFTHATIWTCGPAGVLEDASLLVEKGKITAVGKEGIVAPADAVVIDCKGKFISPGIIDCHSHMATDGGINETGQAITAEVRVGDFVDPDDVNIYRQLAGGVTTINILHGSANPIGGQNQVCKLRWGTTDDAMKFKEAPQGIKFALGENVKQSNWGERFTNRYPQTRMGVEQIMRDEFAAARRYRQQQAAEQKGERKGQLPVRRDLELDAVAQILEGERWIHCHSYRQDEILALLKLCDEYKIQIGTLQHILEGYKVADAIASRKIGGSAFSDWWAYKMEVYDAIPYNGAMMHNAGVVVSFNSDDLELARHLNHEAAKSMKYGGVKPEEAIKFVTINPAKQLRIDQHVGSLEVGKQADVAVWSGPPLAITARCEQTWIEGRKYFDRTDELARRAKSQAMHAALVQKVLQSGDAMLSADEDDTAESELWPRHDEYCGHDHGHDHNGHQHQDEENHDE